MYNPQRFQSTDTDDAFELMLHNPFATLISVVDGKPFISHLPITPKKIDSSIELIGHLARANPHSKFLAGSEVTVIFHGPHTYITPKWYVEDDVPTWNYATVHVKGSVEMIESNQGIIECLKELTVHVEKFWPSGWNFFVPEDLSGEILQKSIVGFKIKIGDLNFKKKLSQNRSAADRVGVLKGLESREDDNSRFVLNEMKKLYSSSGELK